MIAIVRDERDALTGGRDPQAQPAVQSLKISGRGGFLKLFSTHPSLEERIARLETATNL